MKRSDFNYQLPPELIAQQPPTRRGDSRLLRLERGSGELADARFGDLPGFLRAGDLLVFNDTRVIPARLFGAKESGGRVEILLERLTGERSMVAQLRASKPSRDGIRVVLEDGSRIEVRGREGPFYRLESLDESAASLFERLGHVPLPPYIERADASSDRERYQTVYAREAGAVAAPTAGLHFSEPMLDSLREAGIGTAFVTLHVGAGTFQPVRVEELADHRMHAERFELFAETCESIERARAVGGRVVAVGTTAVRTLETAAANGPLKPGAGESRLFIYPPYEFQVVDGLLTNFHLPESTLLMLVAAFAGREPVMAAYRHAVDQRYRFFSYGDAMLILPPDPPST
jgi:S-adenosylmethionine:tRNA ribosyltransferase-isomerase